MRPPPPGAPPRDAWAHARLPRDLRARMEAVQKATGMSISAQIRVAVAAHLPLLEELAELALRLNAGARGALEDRLNANP